MESITMNWDLSGCCGNHARIFLILYFVYLAFILFFWQYQFLKPLKLLAVFVHEMSHGSAAWLTCGKIKSIQVTGESGLAVYSGGVKWLVIPAGYVGGAFWGGCFVALSGSRIGATVAACIITTAMLLALVHNPNKTVVYIAVGFSIVTIAFIIVDWFIFTPVLIYFTLFYGVFFGYYACRDIWDDTVARDTDESDAIMCNRAFPMCKPRCVGVQFLIMGLIFQVVGFYLALVWIVSEEDA